MCLVKEAANFSVRSGETQATITELHPLRGNAAVVTAKHH
jgi:hypothetical protein